LKDFLDLRRQKSFATLRNQKIEKDKRKMMKVLKVSMLKCWYGLIVYPPSAPAPLPEVRKLKNRSINDDAGEGDLGIWILGAVLLQASFVIDLTSAALRMNTNWILLAAV
jgi:hypothetical protein